MDAKRALLHYELPLSAVIVDFHDVLKTATSGYGSLNYELMDEREADIVRLDILVAEDVVEALSTFVYRDKAHYVGKRIVNALKEGNPATAVCRKFRRLGGKIVAGDKLTALRRDVTAKLYGGDVTRKRKLLEKQKKGKKRMAAMGHGKVEIPSRAYLRVLKG